MPYPLLLAFALGSYSSVLWPALPPLVAPGVALLLCATALRWRRGRTVVLILLGVSAGVFWATLWGQARLAAQLPAALDKTEYRVEGTVVGLPGRDARALRFELLVSRVESLAGATPPPLRRLRLSWYGRAPELSPGETWQLVLRLRHPRGFANPDGFDYAGWLFTQGISATGYVRDGVENRRLRAASFLSVDAWRGRVAAHIENLPVPNAGRALLRAFTVGDDRGITVAMWERMRVAGVVHLAVISGLHIALAAGFGMLLGTQGGRLAVVLGAPWPTRHVGALAAWIAGGLYTLMAGFGLATLRAFIMLTVFLAVLLLRRHRMLFAGFIWALAAIAVLEPLAPLAAGFWLSFGAVAVLLAWFGPRPRRGHIRDMVGAQLIVSLGTAAGLLGFFGKLPLLAPLINLLAIPWVEILTVPFCLAGVAAFPLAPVVDRRLVAPVVRRRARRARRRGGPCQLDSRRRGGLATAIAAGADRAVDARAAGAGAALSERHPVDSAGAGRARTATGIAGNRARCGAGSCGGGGDTRACHGVRHRRRFRRSVRRRRWYHRALFARAGQVPAGPADGEPSGCRPQRRRSRAAA